MFVCFNIYSQLDIIQKIKCLTLLRLFGHFYKLGYQKTPDFFIVN